LLLIAPRQLRHPPDNRAIVPRLAQLWSSFANLLEPVLSFVFNGSVTFSPFGTLRHLYCIEEGSRF
jgi:hypothetical protein